MTASPRARSPRLSTPHATSWRSPAGLHTAPRGRPCRDGARPATNEAPCLPGGDVGAHDHGRHGGARRPCTRDRAYYVKLFHAWAGAARILRALLSRIWRRVCITLARCSSENVSKNVGAAERVSQRVWAPLWASVGASVARSGRPLARAIAAPSVARYRTPVGARCQHFATRQLEIVGTRRPQQSHQARAQ